MPAITKAHGGVPVATYTVEKSLDGGESPAIIAVVSFPERDAISRFFASEAYQAVIPLREKAFSHIRFYQTTEYINSAQ